ncbi:MAG TPA: ATP-binding protein [Frankiaceae bacterium]|nr:ATP-binding protein [Frankiaceae bacterium]
MAGDAGDPRSAQLRLPPKATSPARARRFVAETLAEWGVEDGRDDALLVVSELVTNALLHARTPMVVTLVDAGAESIVMCVSDGSRQPPQERHFSLESGTGRGLRLLQSIAIEWGVDDDEHGKTVWCRIRLGDAAYAEFDIDAVEAL